MRRHLMFPSISCTSWLKVFWFVKLWPGTHPPAKTEARTHPLLQSPSQQKRLPASMKLLGSSDVPPTGQQMLGGVLGSFAGNQPNWRTGLTCWCGVHCRDPSLPMTWQRCGVRRLCVPIHEVRHTAVSNWPSPPRTTRRGQAACTPTGGIRLDKVRRSSEVEFMNLLT